MDPYMKFDAPSFNGVRRQPGDALADKKARRNYKLVLDPVLKHGPDKIYRFDGVLPGDPTPVIMQDPRSRVKRFWSKREAANLAVPKFTYDHFYVGTPLPKEVTFTNLNDNINVGFLEDMCKGFGTIEEVQIFYHPKTKKHLGVGKILFTSTRGARACAEKLHNTSKMGKIMNVFVDTMGQERQRLIDEMVAEKPARPPSPETPCRRSDPRSNFEQHEVKSRRHHQEDHGRSHHRDSNFPPKRDNYVPTPQSSDLGYSSGMSEIGYSDGGYSVGQTDMSFGSQSDAGSFVSTPQTPHTPHTPQLGYGDNSYGHNQYGMQQNMSYNMNIGNMGISQNMPSAMPPPPMPSTNPMHPPASNVPHAFGTQYCMPHQHGSCDIPPMMPHQQQQQQQHSHPLPTQGRNQHHNSGYGHYSNQSFHRKDRDRDRDRDKHRDRDRDRRERNRDRRRDRNRDRVDRDNGGRNNDANHRFKSPPAPRVPSPEPERPRNQSLESRIESLLRQTREEPALSGMFGSPEDSHSSHGSSGSSSHGRREEYYEPPPPRPVEVAPPPLPPETPPPLPTMEMPPLPAREDLPPLPPLPPDMEADAEAFSVYNLPHSAGNFQKEPTPVLQEPVCDNTESPAIGAHDSQEDGQKDLENQHAVSSDNHESEPQKEEMGTGGEPKSDNQICESHPPGVSPTPEQSSTAEPASDTGLKSQEDDAMDIEENNDADNDDDDDRMSLSSISSGEQKLEVNVPQPVEQQPFNGTQASTYMDMTQSQLMYWSGAHQQANFHHTFDGSYSNNFGGQGGQYGQHYSVSPMQQQVSLTLTPNEELQEKAFLGVLEQVVEEMKDILQKDLCKRMVQNCAFKCYEVWWDREQNRGKPRKPFGMDQPPVKNSRNWSNRNNHGPPPPSSKPTATTSSQPTKVDTSSTISALFESKDGGFGTNFGMGGLLGLRGGIPKLPSFRRKKFRPPSPPPEEEFSQDQDVITEAETDRPPTPQEDWDEEEGQEKSDAEDEEETAKLKAGRRIIEDSEESDKSESESEKAESEEEEEEEMSGVSSEEEEEESDEASSDDDDEGSSSSEEDEEEEETEVKADAATERVESPTPMEASDADTTQDSVALPRQTTAEEKPAIPLEDSEKAGLETEAGKEIDVEVLDKEPEATLEDLKASEKEMEEEMKPAEKEEEEEAKPQEEAEEVKDKPEEKETPGEEVTPHSDKEAVPEEAENEEEEHEGTPISVINEDDIVASEVEPVAPPVETEDTKVEQASPAAAVEPPKKSRERTTSIDALTDKERGAFDMLMEMQLRPQELTVRTSRERHPSAPESHTLLKDLITRPPLVSPAAEEVVSPQLEPGLEQDAVLALLQMHEEPLRSAAPKTEVTTQEVVETKPQEEDVSLKEEEERKKAQYTMATEHNYFARQPTVPSGMKEGFDSDLTDSASEGEPEQVATLPPEIQIDHNYCVVYYPEEQSSPKKSRQRPVVKEEPEEVLVLQEAEPEPMELDVVKDETVITPDENIPQVPEAKIKEEKIKTPKKKKERKKDKKLKDLTNLTPEIKADLILPPKKVKPTFKARELQLEMQVTYDFLIRGIDPEDINYLKRRYDELLQDDSPSTYWLNDMHWVDHAQTLIPDPAPPKKKRKHSTTEEVSRRHKTGSARTEGYYKIEFVEKLRYLQSSRGVQLEESQLEGDQRQTELTDKLKKKIQQTREARSETRRIQNVLSSLGEDVSDIFKFNQLKFRKKHLKFAKSGIHDWGLFALEPIAAEEMVIEYVGQVVRHSVANMREKNYEACGIGSSYLFRVDSENVIDATKCGNLARFINHSCNPNCYAKIITVESRRKIVIYSKRDINVNDEITYDYKFPIEDEKIICLCGAPNCRGTLN